MVAIIKVKNDGFFDTGLYFVAEGGAFGGTFPFAHLGLFFDRPYSQNKQQYNCTKTTAYAVHKGEAEKVNGTSWFHWEAY